jgi:host factor-I protein
MDSAKGDLQNEFFNAARKERTLVAVFLTNGKKLVGRIRSFDKFTMILEGQQGPQIVYKHAISTVGPYTPSPHGRTGGGGPRSTPAPSGGSPPAPAQGGSSGGDGS